MKKNIAIVAGGDQSEVVVSLKSAEGLKTFIDSSEYNLFIVILEKNNWRIRLENGEEYPLDRNDFSTEINGKKLTFDCVYNTIHGIPGEDGRLQGYLDMIRLPYTSSGVLASSVTFNKFFCNTYLKAFGIKSAESMMLRKGMSVRPEEVIERVGLPCFIKPNAGGSSFGVTKAVQSSDIAPAIEKAFQESDEIIIEAFIKGTEVTNGIYKTLEREVIMPVTEVVPKNEYFDFEAKYTPGMAEEITPARISDELTRKIQKLTSAIYSILGCKGIVRVDYIISDKTIYLLEVNTTPGMTLTSFIPQQIRAMEVPIADVFTEIIEDSIARNQAI
ncbi:D-alanine--D-alanine ligase [Saccharicrinis sp. FJH54]|uniref:D-alanine--D-alanine ligase n=1 Tax=Saccharicrinis sp. FJH54 TaxID=3344665 RepID=UPI0035D510DA